MKLVFVIGCLQGGGAEHVLVSLCNELSRKGHDITVIYNFKNKDYELDDTVGQIDFGRIEYDTFKGNALVRSYKKMANRFRDYFFFRKFIMREQPEVVITFMRNRAETLALACKNRVPLVFSEHSSMMRQPVSRLDNYVRYKLMPKAAAVTVLTQYDKDYVRDTLNNVVVMPNALSFNAITKEEYELLFENRSDLLACGRLTPIKGIDNLIEAYSRIASNYPDWNLDIVGKDIPGGYFSIVLNEMVEKKGLTNRVRFLGFRTDIKELMKSHAIYCLSSRSEGFSLTLTEAMASGMATVSYDLTGPHEITSNEEDGLLVENQSIDALVIGMRRLIEDEQLRYRLGKHAIDNVKRFEKEKIMERWENLFRSLIEKKN